MSSYNADSFIKGTSFEPNAILRGAQLTLVGAYRALQNPALFTSEHYQQAALAVAAGVAIRLLVAIPVRSHFRRSSSKFQLTTLQTFGIQLILQFIGLFKAAEHSTWDADILEGIQYIEHHVLQIPFFLMTFMRYLSPAMDHMFMDSLAWVDQTYVAKHKGENPDDLRAMYYPNLKLYENAHEGKGNGKEKRAYDALRAFFYRFGKKAVLSLAVYLASFLPVVGRFVLPAASFYTFNRAVGTPAAVVIFGSGILVPKRYLVMFLQSYFSSRTMMRELVRHTQLAPYSVCITY